MSTSTPPTGPDPEAIKQVILERYPETVIADALGATFFSLDEKHWPNYATIVTTDEHDEGSPSNLARPGTFRLNIGVSRETFERTVGSITSPDYAAFDQLLPHPVYAKQRWICLDPQPERRHVSGHRPAADRRGARPPREKPSQASGERTLTPAAQNAW